jgi:Uri superfamily endonuclease
MVIDAISIQPGEWPAVHGTYALLLDTPAPLTLAVGRLGVRSLARGRYVYVGSAHGPGGLRARISRHLRQIKPLHWHIDYLTSAVPVIRVWVLPGHVRQECVWVQQLLAMPGAGVPVPGFGNSDCRAGCPAHLVSLPGSLSIHRMEELLPLCPSRT